MLQEETNIFLIGKNALIVMAPILIKHIFEPSYRLKIHGSKLQLVFKKLRI